MSLSAALGNAFSGLTANSRAAALVADNIANATTEGYGRRILELSVNSPASIGGVRIDGVSRQSDPVQIAERRTSDAHYGYANDLQAFAQRLEDTTGTIDGAGTLMSRVTAFESALIAASSDPSSDQRLELVSIRAQDLSQKFNDLSTHIQQARTDADHSIDRQVNHLNDALVKIDNLNKSISLSVTKRTETASLQDQRQRAIDDISQIIPIRVVEKERGAVSIFSASGAMMLDGGRPATFEFQKSNLIEPDQTLANGSLSGLTLNGYELDTSASGLVAGGTLAAQFEIRDSLAVTRQSELDGLARDLVERLGAGGPDTTLNAGDPGFFTDAGSVFNTANETGLAQRIQVNTLVNPASTEIWRIRDGLAAAAPGEVGDSALINNIYQTLQDPQSAASTALSATALNFGDQTASFVSRIAGARVKLDEDLSYHAAQNSSLRELEFATGVDTDQELQDLLRIEQQYAANAQVMSIVDELMERLLAI